MACLQTLIDGQQIAIDVSAYVHEPAYILKILIWPAFRKSAANPHGALLAKALQDSGVRLADWTPLRALFSPGNCWHIHHPETVLFRRSTSLALAETVSFVVLLTLARFRGTRVVWTIHDLGSNDRLHPRLESWFWRWYTQRVNVVIGLTQHSLVLADETFFSLRKLPHYVIPHGHYLDVYTRHISQAHARSALTLDENSHVVLHFGLLRPYKNVPTLIRCFAQACVRDSTLLVAGRPFDEKVRLLVERCAREQQDKSGSDIRLHLRHIDDEEVPLYFAAADLVVLPYERILNSGALILSLSLNTPVLVPSLGSMPEHESVFGDHWVRLYHGELTARHITEALEWARTTERAPIDWQPLAWRELALQTKQVYEKL